MFPAVSDVHACPRPWLQVVPECGVATIALEARGAGVGPQSGAPGAPRGRRVDRRRPRVRWSRLAAWGVVVGVTVLLALPVSALAGRPAVMHGTVAGAPIGGFVYVVQPGDTLWTIARQFDQGGDPQELVAALSQRLGSQVVVPGERIRVP